MTADRIRCPICREPIIFEHFALVKLTEQGDLCHHRCAEEGRVREEWSETYSPQEGLE